MPHVDLTDCQQTITFTDLTDLNQGSQLTNGMNNELSLPPKQNDWACDHCGYSHASLEVIQAHEQTCVSVKMQELWACDRCKFRHASFDVVHKHELRCDGQTATVDTASVPMNLQLVPPSNQSDAIQLASEQNRNRGVLSLQSDLTPEQMQRVCTVFDKIDTDGGGTIDLEVAS